MTRIHWRIPTCPCDSPPTLRTTRREDREDHTSCLVFSAPHLDPAFGPVFANQVALGPLVTSHRLRLTPRRSGRNVAHAQRPDHTDLPQVANPRGSLRHPPDRRHSRCLARDRPESARSSGPFCRAPPSLRATRLPRFPKYFDGAEHRPRSGAVSGLRNLARRRLSPSLHDRSLTSPPPVRFAAFRL